MEGRFKFNNPFVREQDEDVRMIPENCDSPPNSGMINDRKKITTSSPKKRRAAQKRVVSIPIGDVSRVKGEGAPPSDSWAWRKYGQKPIKGSPYPRGYYRCSSSKGCPARKQVERSRVDPTMLVITYACEHNHPWPASKNSNTTTTTTTTTTNDNKSRSEEPPGFSNQKETETEPDHKFADLGDESLITTDDFGWFSYVASTTPTMLESPICSGNINEGADVAMIFPMGEEDESLFADLGELPECSVVFQRGFMEQEERRTRCSLREASWCQSTG